MPLAGKKYGFAAANFEGAAGLAEARRMAGKAFLVVGVVLLGIEVGLRFFRAADAGLEGGRSFYSEQLEKFVTIYRSPPGREHYEVVIADLPAVAASGLKFCAVWR